MATLYQHQIYCLHGTTGQTTADVAAADTTFSVQQAVLDDVTIAVGSQIQLTDGVNTSPTMTIQSIDDVLDTVTVDNAAGFIFLAATPTLVNRLPQPAWLWTESPIELVTCPELASHPVQAGSAITVDIRKPEETTIKQSGMDLSHPEVKGEPLGEGPPDDRHAGPQRGGPRRHPGALRSREGPGGPDRGPHRPPRGGGALASLRVDARDRQTPKKLFRLRL